MIAASQRRASRHPIHGPCHGRGGQVQGGHRRPQAPSAAPPAVEVRLSASADSGSSGGSTDSADSGSRSFVPRTSADSAMDLSHRSGSGSSGSGPPDSPGGAGMDSSHRSCATHNTAATEASLRESRAVENAPSNRLKHFMLARKREAYKRLTADTSQVCDGRSGRSVEALLRRSSDPGAGFHVNFGNEEEEEECRPRTVKLGRPRRSTSASDLTRWWEPQKSSKAHQRDGGRGRRGGGSGAGAGLGVSWHPGDYLRGLEPSFSAESAGSDDALNGLDEGKRKKDGDEVEGDKAAGLQPLRSDLDGGEDDPSGELRACRRNYRPVGNGKGKGSKAEATKPSPAAKKETSSRASSKATSGQADRRRRSSDDTTSTEGSTVSTDSAHSDLGPEAAAASADSGPAYSKAASAPAAPRDDKNQGPKVALRRKYTPRHRCQNTNRAVTGIVRPSRYSPHLRSKTLDDYGKTKLREARLTGSFTQLSPSEIERLRSLKDDDQDDDDDLLLSTHSVPTLSPRNRLRRKSSDSNAGAAASDELDGTEHSHASLRSSLNSSLHSHASSWIPQGVDFSASMEVYVFEKER
ncbi:hypothetical protein ACHAWF_007922 [Thalassiosira exigua]